MNFITMYLWNTKTEYKTFIRCTCGTLRLSTKHSFIGIYGIFRKTPFRSARLTQRYDFWISPISMNLDVF
jgi:hypothetical protein